MTKSHKKLSLFDLFHSIAQKLIFGIWWYPKKLRIAVSYLDSPNAQVCCSWKRRDMLISVAFLKKSLLVLSIQGASSVFWQLSRASRIRFSKTPSKLPHFRTVPHQNFDMTLSSESKFDFKLSKCFKNLSTRLVEHSVGSNTNNA